MSRIFEWEEDDYPECPLCLRSTPYFKPYKKGILRILRIKVPETKIVAQGKCLWGCEFDAIVPKSWLGKKLIDPNGIMKEWASSSSLGG